MTTTHALHTPALTSALQGSLHAIRLRIRRRALVREA
jgi:hypothetical protein